MILNDDLFREEIILENEIARLTPLNENDFSELNKIAYDPRIWEWGMSNVVNAGDLQKYISVALEERSAKASYPFLIFDKKMNCVAGSTRFVSISIPNNRVEIGWTWIHPKHHGTGLNKACKYLLLQFAFEMLKVNRVELKTDVLNLQSRKAILKIGAIEEGVFRKYQVTSTGRVRDSVYFSIINIEWENIKNTIFKDLPGIN